MHAGFCAGCLLIPTVEWVKFSVFKDLIVKTVSNVFVYLLSPSGPGLASLTPLPAFSREDEGFPGLLPV